MNNLLSYRHNAESSDIGNVPLLSHYRRIRERSEQLCAPLQIEDYGIQVATFSSPPKWHLAHMSWFFETLLLKPYLRGYREFHPQFATLFNSYYDTIGAQHPRPERGMLSRPTVHEVYRYRAYVDEHMLRLLSDTGHPQYGDMEARTRLGLNHEQQHQELFLTDLKYNFGYNPLKPAYTDLPEPPQREASPLEWLAFEGGVQSIGYQGDMFSYDNEGPCHKVYLGDFRLASKPVSNGEYLEFMRDGGYDAPGLWLSDAWKTVRGEGWRAPLYWQQEDDTWFHMTLAGMRPVDMNAPVSHISHFEAAAFARWAGKRLPSEAEWELAAATVPVAGNFVESGYLQPIAPERTASKHTAAGPASGLQQMFGDVWEWTASPYMPYPGYQQAEGPLGEYNGKFMSGQMVLRGGSCATPQDHIRPTYRNFFYPHERWQFSGFRLAEDIR